MPCVNSALWYVVLEKMGNLEKMLIEGTDLGVGMVIRDSMCQRLTVCDHMHSGGMIQLPLKSDNLLLPCVAVGSASLRQAWPLYCIMFLLLASSGIQKQNAAFYN